MYQVSRRWLNRSLLASVLSSVFCVAALAGAPSQVSICASCHGTNGQGNQTAGYPALAGLPALYIGQQLTAFEQGTRVNAIMKQMAVMLNADQIKAIANYYASMKVQTTLNPNPMPNVKGAQLAVDGDWGGKLTGIPACDSCHGPQGIGVGNEFPRLAGQPKSYLTAQLKDWQEGSRKNDPLDLMGNVAHKLNASEINAVAAYYASLPANPANMTSVTNARESK